MAGFFLSSGQKSRLFKYGRFTSHGGMMLPWKIDCDNLADDDIDCLAQIIRSKFLYRDVYGVPRGGLRLAEKLRRYCSDGYPVLLVDDVLTTGSSMEELRSKIRAPVFGVVIFARGPCPDWIRPIFLVEEWARGV